MSSPWNRRDFLRGVQAIAIAAALDRAYARVLPEQVAGDEYFWEQIRNAYASARDPKLLNFNNGGCAPAPNAVLEAEIDAIRYSNLLPTYRMWNDLEPRIESVRKKMAAMWDVDPECVAITRNASESLENAQLGLDLQPGDEVLLTGQDYPRMITTWQQRERRDHILLKQLDYAVPVDAPNSLVALFERAITPRTRVIHFSQVIFMTGQIFPVKELCALARSRGIVSIVDGAHAFAHVPFKFSDFDCDYYGASLHKWLSAPIGTGMLYIRKDRIEKTWPLMAAPLSMDKNIRKFEEIGTHPAAMHNGIQQALEFHQHIGDDRKFARMRYLTRRWADRLTQLPGSKLLAKPDQAGAFLTIQFDGVDPGKLVKALMDQHNIFTTPITGPGFNGIRVSPNIYTSPEEVDRFAEAVAGVVTAIRS